MTTDVRAWLRGKLVRAVQEAVKLELDRRDAALAPEARSLLERRLRHDVGMAMDAAAVRSSADLVLTGMRDATTHVTPHDTLRYALSQATGPGMLLEFGVATGTTLRIIAEAGAGRRVLGFDAFAGLPERWRVGFDEGHFAQAPPDVPGAELVIGYFDDTLPGFVASNPGPVAFLHCDADLYTSTTTILSHVGPRLRAGSVVLFDEYFNFPWWQEHEHKAWTEWTEQHGVTFEYIAFTWEHEQVAVKVLTTPWDSGDD